MKMTTAIPAEITTRESVETTLGGLVRPFAGFFLYYPVGASSRRLCLR